MSASAVDIEGRRSLPGAPDDGGTFDKTVAHLTVDKHGVRGAQPGFDKDAVATHGVGQVATRDFIGQTTWSSFVPTTGWQFGDKQQWPSKFAYDDPRFVKTIAYVRSLTDRGFSSSGRGRRTRT